ncbi:MAG: hypothetical protein KDE63_06750 [Novosphingobium sp.]|nr:hypothetical protein [Novosphingobium sp.]
MQGVNGLGILGGLLLCAGAALVLAGPAMAQDADYRVNQLIIYGDDECPASSGDEITVCARKDEGERYRIPEDLRKSDDPANNSWTDRVEAYETVGASGTLSCSPTGLGGWSGCQQELLKAAYGEKGEAASIRFGELIAQERAKRLSTIDEDAADEQSRVEVLEKEYEARKAAEAEAAASGTELTPSDDTGGQ